MAKTRDELYKGYFDAYHDCRAHRKDNCEQCLREVEKEFAKESHLAIIENAEAFSHALINVPMQSDVSSEQRGRQIEMSDVFHKQADMVQTVLELSDEELGKIKVSELPKMLEKVRKEATIGHMKKLLAPRPGLLEKLLFGRK